MADPTRLRILKALTDALKGITPANGFTYDLSEAVFRGRNLFDENDPEILVSILEPPESLDERPGPVDTSASIVEWPLLVQGFCVDDPVNPTDPAHILMAEVKMILVRERRRRKNVHTKDILGMGVVVDRMVIGGGVVRPPDFEVSNRAYFWLPLTLTIADDNDDPFA